MFRFADIQFLWLLLLVPVCVVGFVLYTMHKRRQRLAFGDPALVRQLMPDASRKRPVIKFSILMFALTLLIIAAARPQKEQSSETIEQEGIEVMIAFDVSNSMLAQDVAPCRLDRAKLLFTKVIDHLENDRVGLVVFAGESFVQLPITCDNASAKMFLGAISPDMIATQGTAIGGALRKCIDGFGAPTSAGRCIILLTDGENHEDDAAAVAAQAFEMGIRVFVLGIGKPEGAPIPDNTGRYEYKKDRNGNVVISKLNEQMCQSIAQAGHGMYVRCDNSNSALSTLLDELEELEKVDYETELFHRYTDQYQTFVIIALILLVLDFFIFARQNHVLSKLDIFKEKK